MNLLELPIPLPIFSHEQLQKLTQQINLGSILETTECCLAGLQNPVFNRFCTASTVCTNREVPLMHSCYICADFCTTPEKLVKVKFYQPTWSSSVVTMLIWYHWRKKEAMETTAALNQDR